MQFEPLLKPGMVLQAENGDNVVIQKQLGSGGQGEVWQAKLPAGTGAVKCYYDSWFNNDSGLWERLGRLVAIGQPTSSLVWPLTRVQSSDGSKRGYVMPLIDLKRFSEFRHLDTCQVNPSFKVLATIGYELAEAFWQLHAKGLCYRDISKSNVHFDKNSGEVRVFDNDNVDVNGSEALIRGTPDFMAPELVRQESGVLAGRHTDMYSLAVLLFCLFHRHHPLVGKRALSIRCWDDRARLEMYGRQPVYIFNAVDTRNAAQPKDQRTDPGGEAGANALLFTRVHPSYLKNLFHQSFTAGLSDPGSRIPVPDWRGAMVRLRDGVLYCRKCGTDSFTEDSGDAVGGYCWNSKCGERLKAPVRLRVRNLTVVLNGDTKLYPHHIDPRRSFDFSVPVAELRQHPAKAELWGLANLTASTWSGYSTNGTAIEVPPGRSVLIEKGTRVHFGLGEGVFVS